MTRALRLTLTVVAAALALAGLAAGYVKWELAEPEAFADRGVDALQSEAVRVAIAEQIVVAALERRSPDLVDREGRSTGSTAARELNQAATLRALSPPELPLPAPMAG